MNKRSEGMSMRKYAQRAGCSLTYIEKLVRQGKIPRLADGSLDAATCDRAREKNTNMARGERRRQRQAARAGLSADFFEMATCAGCSETYRVSEAERCGSPDVNQFCTAECAQDAQAGLTAEQIRRKIAAY